MIDGVPSHPLGAYDNGADRDDHRRDLLCTRQARCLLEAGHSGECFAVLGPPCAPSDFGPEASKRRRY